MSRSPARIAALSVLAVIATARLAHADDPLYTCRPAAPDAKLAVSFKPDTSIKDLVTWVLGFTCKNIVVASDVPKAVTRVTIIAPNVVTPKQALQLFVDAVEATGLVVTQKPDTIIISLGPKFPRGCPDTAPTASAPVAPTPATPPAPALDDTERAELIAKAVKKIDDTHVEVRRDLAAQLVDDLVAGKSFRIVPAMKDGKPDGLKLYAIRPSSLAAALNLANGDTVQSIALDGAAAVALDSADKALDVYTKTKTAKHIDLAIVRRGKPLTLSITVVK